MNGCIAARRVVVQPQLVVVVGQRVRWMRSIVAHTDRCVVASGGVVVRYVAVVVVAAGVERLGQDYVVHGGWHRVGVVAGEAARVVRGGKSVKCACKTHIDCAHLPIIIAGYFHWTSQWNTAAAAASTQTR